MKLLPSENKKAVSLQAKENTSATPPQENPDSDDSSNGEEFELSEDIFSLGFYLEKKGHFENQKMFKLQHTSLKVMANIP